MYINNNRDINLKFLYNGFYKLDVSNQIRTIIMLKDSVKNDFINSINTEVKESIINFCMNKFKEYNDSDIKGVEYIDIECMKKKNLYDVVYTLIEVTKKFFEIAHIGKQLLK